MFLNCQLWEKYFILTAVDIIIIMASVMCQVYSTALHITGKWLVKGQPLVTFQTPIQCAFQTPIQCGVACIYMYMYMYVGKKLRGFYENECCAQP